jgi:hypothetical protein
MSTPEGVIKRELTILFQVLCDGLHQDVRHRELASLTSGQNFSITQERGEQGVVPSLAAHLRLAGFFVQLEAYFPGNARIRPDLRIWLPASRQYIYLEAKQVAWGRDVQYDYSYVVKDIEKLNRLSCSGDIWKGVLVFGFSKPKEWRENWLLDGFKKLSQEIIGKYSYEKIGLERVELKEMDSRTSYAMIGLWVCEAERKRIP